MNKEIVSKIQRLLALSASDNAHEAELALSHARRIALEHDLDLAVLARSGATVTEKIEDKSVSVGGRVSVCQRFVSNIIETHFNVRVFKSGSRDCGRNMVFIGKASDITVAEYVQEFLNREFMRLWHRARARFNYATEDRNSFFMGIYRGLNAKLTREKAEIIGARSADVQTSYALVVVDNTKQVDLYIKSRFSRVTVQAGSKMRLRNGAAIRQGEQDGGNINIRRGINDASPKTYLR